MPRKLGKKSIKSQEEQNLSGKLTKHKTVKQIQKDILGSLLLIAVCIGALAGVYYFDQSSSTLSDLSVRIYSFLNI